MKDKCKNCLHDLSLIEVPRDPLQRNVATADMVPACSHCGARDYGPLTEGEVADAMQELIHENMRLREDSAQVFIEELVVTGGGMDASLSCQPFTKVLAHWALESFKAQSEGDWVPNLVSMEFGIPGQERYIMSVRRLSGQEPEYLVGKYREQRDKLVAAADQAMEEMKRHGSDAYSILQVAVDKIRGDL